MQFFNDYWASTFDELLSWYPGYYREIREMVAILKIQGKWFDEFKENLQRVFDNCFVDSMDEETVTAMENWLNLRLYRTRTLEERRGLIKAFFVGHGHLTADLIKATVSAYTDSDVDVYFEPIESTPGYEYYEPGNNMLHINYQKGATEILYLNDVDSLISRLIPAHILYQSALTYRFEIDVPLKKKHYLKDFEQCGTRPDISGIGRRKRPEVDVDTTTGIVNATTIKKTFKGCGSVTCGSGTL